MAKQKTVANPPKRLPTKALPTPKKRPTKVVPSARKLPTKADDIGAIDARFLPMLWIYKCNIEAAANGDWNYFFEAEKQGDGLWGGTWCINNNASLKYLREEVQVGHLVLAWQSDRPAAMGLCRMADLPEDGYDISIVLETLMVFQKPINLLKYKRTYPALKNGTGFQQGNAGTLFPTTPEEAKVIFQLCRVPVSLLNG